MKVIILTILLFCQSSYASKQLKISFGETLQPWVSLDGGILLDIIKETLSKEGYELVFSFDPYARRILSYKNNEVDIVSDINKKVIKEHDLKGYFSNNFYAYENYAISLRERKLDISSIDELKKYSLLSWQGASTRMGSEYAKMVKENIQYAETHDQKKQVLLLFNKRYDFIQMDKQIFNYYRELLIKEGKISKNTLFDMKPLFGKSKNGFMFKDEKIRNIFINNLKKLKNNFLVNDAIFYDEIN
ncbi:transporter substrate-binding domain-containing protein [Bacteriovorax sp. Seq25_V]|uniref:transporter substrate-binding domain-containing protein n=1 Tax=Bacteriovorax sp. Seq25_V TaxID=1201288 RepID=UPI00038A2962|nr:transporter substrate-binding domain-containing protein [Bacteriovorax sp. Seq25_V]EQC47501.1 ABC transporter, substrate-binding protein, family 3 [Bacteriovorax sp. Seq25_V]